MTTVCGSRGRASKTPAFLRSIMRLVSLTALRIAFGGSIQHSFDFRQGLPQ